MHPVLRPIWAVAVALARVATRLAPESESKVTRSFALRHGVLGRIRASAAQRDIRRPLVWLHAPSVGEGLQARPVLEALRAAHPDWQLAYTYFSPSAESFARKLNVDFCDVLPFDGAREAAALLDAWQPDALAFVKLDVWPVLAEAAHARGVATALISATLASNSGRQGAMARALLHDAYRSLSAVGAIADADASRLVALGVHADRVSVTGDTRMDQVWARARAVDANHWVRSLLPSAAAGAADELPRNDAKDAASRLRPNPSTHQVLVCGSTWPSDEAALLPALLEWMRAYPTARVIIAPHEPTPSHLSPISDWAARFELPLVRLSESERDPRAPWRVLLVDRIGVLGDLYALGTMAFVGGGFHGAGLHSVLEPAAFGIPVLFGPQYANAREAGELLQRGGAVRVHSSEEIEAQLALWSENDLVRVQNGVQARELVQEGLGSTRRVVDVLESLVERRGLAAG